MDATCDPRATGHLVNTQQIETLGVFGPEIQILTPLAPEDTWPCFMREPASAWRSPEASIA
ncbi:MAG: hypothetical protein M3Z20_10535 [Chloroflexota bacterium]|nr:hypothetical protein [Chloroflexota bacterium]